MKMNLLFIFLLLTGKCFSQAKETLITDSSVVKMKVVLKDTSYTIQPSRIASDWMIYYDSAHTQEAIDLRHVQTTSNTRNKKAISFDRYDCTMWYANGAIRS